ncbi:hypothetical protein BpHYR1_018439 [Brachionus plicatilis]|uniref:Uncharacterized protein n=1 Tax=Brachionus plicatilis TaxID=10195 RepID=A0A3M7QPG9_BRAPC|nr:hypothetical protein BpHYR1_018439 [Brachionus plicatilis]
MSLIVFNYMHIRTDIRISSLSNENWIQLRNFFRIHNDRAHNFRLNFDSKVYSKRQAAAWNFLGSKSKDDIIRPLLSIFCSYLQLTNLKNFVFIYRRKATHLLLNKLHLWSRILHI